MIKSLKFLTLISVLAFISACLTGCNVNPPLLIDVRSSNVGNGYVVQITNRSSSETIQCEAYVIYSSGMKSTPQRFIINPGKTKNFGWMENSFEAINTGDKIIISATGYSYRKCVTIDSGQYHYETISASDEEALANESPADAAPAEEAPAEEAPAVEAPVDEVAPLN